MVGRIGGNGNVSSSYGSGDPYGTNPAFVAQIDAVWEEIQAYRNDPSSANIQELMKSVTSLNAYFTANGVPPTSDTGATNIYNMLNGSPGSSVPSLAQECATGGASMIAYIQQQLSSQNDIFANLYTFLNNNYGSSDVDQSNAQIKADLIKLENMITNYQNNVPPTWEDAADLAGAINQFMTDAKAIPGGLTDGYLTNIVNFLNMPLSSGNPPPTLASLAAAWNNNPSDESAFENALGAVVPTGNGSAFQAGTLGADLAWLVQHGLSDENWD